MPIQAVPDPALTQFITTFKPHTPMRPCVLICSGWPSWLLVTKALSLDCLCIFHQHLSTAWKLRFSQTHPDTKWFPLASVLQDYNLPPNCVILLQGPPHLFTSIPGNWFLHHLCLYSASCQVHPHEIPQTFQSFTIAHAACGGVTDGSWTVASNQPVLWTTPASVPRQVRHIVNQASPHFSFPRCPPPSQDSSPMNYPKPLSVHSQQLVYDWNGLLPTAHPHVSFRLPSVFLRNTWIHRPLTSTELACAFDISPAFQDPSCSLGASMLLATPPKVLLSFGLQALHSPGGLRSLPQAEQHTVDGLGPMSIPMSVVAADAKGVGINAWNSLVQRQEEKAARADDASIPFDLWNNKVWNLQLHSDSTVRAFAVKFDHPSFLRKHALERPCPLAVLRQCLLGRWQRNVYRDLVEFMRAKHGTNWLKPLFGSHLADAVREVLHRVCRATFWEWKDGSSLIFWRWPEGQQKYAVEGYPSWVVSDLPCYRRRQKKEKDPDVREKMRSKLQLVRDRRYVEKGLVKSLTSYFTVPKGDGDVRMVYDASKSGLNRCLWVPSFHLPSVDALIRVMDSDSWMGDLDLGDMFLNFPLDVNLRPYCGIDLSPIIEEATSWESWTRCMMGLKPSPYFTIKAFHFAFEVVMGDKTDPENVFHWSIVIFNLPGQCNYDPTKPRVWKLNPTTGKMAAATLVYVDDLRTLGASWDECWRVMHRIATHLTFLGIQVSARKTRAPTPTPGPWAGAVAWASDEGICVRSTKEKWDKARRLVHQLQRDMTAYQEGAQPEGINFKQLESARGFLVHMQRTYPALTPYLKGIHLTLDSWRPGRDAEGWKNRCFMEDDGFWDDVEGVWIPWEDAPQTAPVWVRPVPRLSADLQALSSLLSSESPPLRYVRKKRIHVAIYGFVDASGLGFGSSFQHNAGIRYSFGVWGRDSTGHSSNFRELNNLVTALEQHIADGSLIGSEVFVFTDNTTAESAFYKGNTSSKLLFSLVLRLRHLEMSGMLLLNVIHVAGTRMIQQGTDGLSRGDLSEGVLAGHDMLSFVPLHLSALQRQPALLDWVHGWTGLPSLEPLTPEEWFDRGHGHKGGFRKTRGQWMPCDSSDTWLLWTPPPAAADVAVEELLISRHKRTHLNHIFIVPRLTTHLWRKKLYKVSDLVFELPVGQRSFWPSSEHEPLIVGLTLRFTSCPPWQLRQSSSVLELGRQLQSMWASAEGSEGTILRQLSDLPRYLESM